MDNKNDRTHLSFIDDGEMDIPLAHLPKYTDSPKNVIDIWMEKMAKGLLTPAHFKDHWRIWVPKFYSVEPGAEWTFENDKANCELIDNLERFIANGDFETVMNRLKDVYYPSSVCGKVFKMGEPLYSCKECGVDFTCVLCVSCFKNSAHKNHNYKMATGIGGGCCDCGDIEAWKNDPFCDIHYTGNEVQKETHKPFPEDMAERVKITFTAVLKYAYQVLTLEHSPGLPHDLRLKEAEQDPFSFSDSPDIYCTVLYNDEIHTFEQVINTLRKIVKCSQKDAIEYVTNIDREGRVVTKCTTFQQCQELKTDIERFTSKHGGHPLKVDVVHTHVIAHQAFAMKLLKWLQKILTYFENFRQIFSDVALTPIPPDPSIVEGILLRDSKLWKSARSHWHRIFISGMLMQYSSKKALAKVFTKNYGTVIKDFIDDDQDHSFSVASLSVQIFTAPTLTHHLIAEEQVLFILFHTFMSECSKKLNKSGKLQFERNVSNQSFKRALYILYDLKYLFNSVPTDESQWTDNLRRGFLQGFSSFLNLLTCMQGMDSVTRQVVQHLEFEPVWEAAFQLHIKLSSVISLIIKWCGSDRVVLIKAFRATLNKLNECRLEGPQTTEVRELADHSATCIQFDVSTQPVSIHLPLSRFLAGLYLHLEKYGLAFDSPEFQTTAKPSPEEIIEPVLRTQVMIAQVHSAMWRRNGYSILNQLYLYHSVRCRTEMLDRDIVMLQIGATLIQSDEFLIHLLNKFNLLNWADPDFEENSLKNRCEEDSMHQTISLVEEFLGLLIVLVGERMIPGVGKITPDDQIQKQIIQQLCIKPMAHSELSKTLPDDVNHETGLEKVIDKVAIFKKPPQVSGKGLYELKPELYDQYNMFFYHYTKEELSKSEEEQRKRRKAAGELECCPPPKLPPLTEAFSMLPNLLQCDIMFHIIQTVLKRCINLKARSFSEHQLQKVLHLIGYALQEEESKQYPYLVFSEKSVRWGIEDLLLQLLPSARVEAHRDMLTWTLNKFKQVKADRESNENTSRVSVLEQGSLLGENSGKDSKEWRAKMAAEKRAKILAQISAMQKNFMKENAKLFENSVSYLENMVDGFSMAEGYENTEPVALGPKQTGKILPVKTHTCILCQEETTVSVDGPALVSSAFIQKSTVHANSRSEMEKPDEVLTKPWFLPTSLRPQPHTSTCSHIMHSSCWKKYFDVVLAKENRRLYRPRQSLSFDVQKREFFCPLCECLSNTVLPLIPPLGSIKANPPVSEVSFEKFIEGLSITLKFKGRQQTSNIQGISTSDDAEEESSTSTLLYTCPVDKVQMEMGESSGPLFSTLFPQESPPTLSPSLVEMILHFAQATFTKGLSINSSVNSFIPVMAWNTCYYTIFSTESLLTEQNKPLMGALSSREKDCLENLTRFAGILGTVWERPHDISNHALFMLSMILEGNSKTQELPCILDWDSFGLLVPLTLSLPNLFCNNLPGGIPSGSILELYTLKLVFLSHVTRVLLTSKFYKQMENDDDDGELAPSLSSEESETLLEILSSIRRTCNYDVMDVWQLNAYDVWETVKTASLPFLRCCALFYHFLTDVPYPVSLTEYGGDTYETLCKYLGLPLTVTELFDTPKYKELMTGWLTHERVPGYLASNSFVKLPKAINGLVVLPEDYSELINMVSTFTCPNSDRDDSRNPTMCLVCGEMLCSQSYCCQQELSGNHNPTSQQEVCIMVGACTFHAHRCGANCGIFLRVRECEILLLASPNRGCVLPAPYLDRYGEADQGLSRGNPLRLNLEQYHKLKILWLSHGVHEKISRAIESGNNVLSAQWLHL